MGSTLLFTLIEKDPLSFRSRSFDMVLFLEVLEHLTANPLMALLGIHRTLKERGVLILSTLNVASLFNRLRLLWDLI